VKPALFGIELEFFLMDADGLPALGATKRVIDLWRERELPNPPVPELGSFQIELNPGPWSLTEPGIAEAIAELSRDVANLERCSADLGLVVSKSVFVPRIGPGQLQDPNFLANTAHNMATSTYFANGGVTVQFEDGTPFTFPGETVLACLNEIHIHAQLPNDRDTINLFNFFNQNGQEIVKPFQKPIVLNGLRMTPEWNTMRMFQISDGEPNRNNSFRRVGFLPEPIESFADYERAVSTFNPIPCPALNPPYLDLDSSVWFWVRLRGQVDDLRTEFRPLDMGEDWKDRVRFLSTTCLNQSLQMMGNTTRRSSNGTERKSHNV